MTTPPEPPPPAPRARYKRPAILLLAGGGLVAAALVARAFVPSAPPKATPPRHPREIATNGRLTLWWDGLPPAVERRSVRSGEESNVNPADYAGPSSCRKCHPANYASWSHHPHRWMNALAGEDTVKGDFSGKASISYLGGRATFYTSGGKFRMRLERGAVRRVYEVTQTIGSRFFQYYVGKQLEGPEPKGHHFYARDHVLAFGYWLDRREWVPVVHVGSEKPDGQRPDPFAPPDRGAHYAEYSASCNHCHTTFPLGDQLSRSSHVVGTHSPARLHWSLRDYLEEAHPEVVPDLDERVRRGLADNPMTGWDARTHGVTLGVSCEACHLGAKAHVESEGAVPPRFFPSSPHLFVEGKERPPDPGRTHDNVNWACGRCHTGGRPTFAAGMSTWNSVEYSDAMLGSCYSKLRCVDCHNPHRGIGPKWKLSADQDDALCLKCHDQFRPEPRRVQHTHHPMGSEGARCMNCHMPRVNEGVQDVVRTHMIYSPTRADMLEANHPNACNLCHTDKPIDWTLRYLKDWYGAKVEETKVGVHYPHRDQPAALGWLRSEDPAVRLVAADALTRARDARALPQLIGALDDPYLVNRQFAGKGLEEMLGVRLSDFGYRFYMTPAERSKPLAGLRARFARPPKPGRR